MPKLPLDFSEAYLPECTVDGCSRPRRKEGLCKKCYRIIRREYPRELRRRLRDLGSAADASRFGGD